MGLSDAKMFGYTYYIGQQLKTFGLCYSNLRCEHPIPIITAHNVILYIYIFNSPCDVSLWLELRWMISDFFSVHLYEQ